MGPKSPSSLSFRSMLSRYPLDAFPSQICTPFSCRTFAFVEPLMNHSNSSTTPRQKTRFVVRSGKDLRRLNRIWQPNFDNVPVPVRSPFWTPLDIICCINLRY
eukprot:Gb_18228 [translate_table: standard]